MQPLFNNRHNPKILSNEGKTYWHSRSCAVVAEVIVYNQQEKQWYVLLGKRGSNALDFQGFWGLPCGYLDWDETLCQAVVREVWEECGLYLPHLSQQAHFVASNSSLVHLPDSLEHYSDEPWYISDLPSSNRQNISFHYAVLMVFNSGFLPALSFEHADENEVDALSWIPLEQAINMELAFNHAQRIKECWLRHERIMHDLIR